MLLLKSAVGYDMNSMVYVVSNGLDLNYYLIDIGDWRTAKSILPGGAVVKGVFITHGHHDHITGLNELKAAFPNCEVYASKESIPMLRSAKANLSFYKECPFQYNEDVIELQNGNHIAIFDGVELEVVATPGHHPSCLSFILGDYIFTGDSYIPGVKVVTKLPGGNRQLAEESIKKIIELSKDKIVCPGHYVDNMNKTLYDKESYQPELVSHK